jgi:hypothetical protein
MIHSLLIFFLKVILYAGLTGGVFFLVWYLGHTHIDGIIAKALSARHCELRTIEDANGTFEVSPQRKWWSGRIRTKYSGVAEKILYRKVTFIKSGETRTCLAAVYTAPFIKPQVFFQADI